LCLSVFFTLLGLIVLAYVEGLARGLKDEDPEVRLRVANALKALEDPRATLPLVEALGDPCGDVSRAAIRTLSSIGDERARPALLKALREENFSLRLWAAIGLQKIGDEDSVEGLIEALRDPDEGVRLQAVYALAGIGDKRAVKPLQEALDDEDTYVQEAARNHLRDVFGVDTGVGYVEAARLLSERSVGQCKLNLRLEKVLKVVGRLGGESGEVLDEDLYRVLSVEHGFNEDEAIGLTIELMRAGLVYTPKLGYTRISV